MMSAMSIVRLACARAPAGAPALAVVAGVWGVLWFGVGLLVGGVFST